MNFFAITVLALLCLVAAMWTHLDRQKDELAQEPPLCVPPYQIVWHEWEPGLPEAARDRGRVVWLQFTAMWGFTALANEQRLFSNAAFIEKLAEHRVFLIKADFTEKAPEIAKELMKHGGLVLPKTVVFPASGNGEELHLSDLLDLAEALEALDQAAGM